MKRRADTPTRISRRKYEETHKEKRQEQNKVWGTSIPRKEEDKINAFLEKFHLTKVDLIKIRLDNQKSRLHD